MGSAWAGRRTLGASRAPGPLPEKVPEALHWVPPQGKKPAEGVVPIRGG